MAIAYNPTTGEAHFWDGNDWVPSKVAVNPDTGVKHAWDGYDWKEVPGTAAPKENLLSDIYGFGKKGVGEGISGVGWLADKATGYGSAMQKYGNEITEAADAAISPQAKERANRALITEAQPGEGLFGYNVNPSALAGAPYQIAESLPGMVAGIGATAVASLAAPEAAIGAIGATALRVLGPWGVRAATSVLGEAGVAAATAAGKNVIEAAAPIVGKAVFATLAGNATEGLQAAGMNGEQTETTVLAALKADPSLLQKTRAGQEALQETGGDVEAAIKIAAAKAAGKVAWQTGLSTALLATPGSAFEARMLQGGLKHGALKEAGLGAFSEGLLQEAPQSAAEQYLQNIAQMPYDPSITPGQGVLNAAIQGGVVGGIMGGGAGVISNSVSGTAPDQDLTDRMGRRVSSDELNTAIGDVRRDAIARKAASFSPESVPENIDLVSDAVIESYRQQGMSDQEIADVYPPYAEALNRRAAEFAAQQDAMTEGLPGLETVDTPSYNLPPGMTLSENVAERQAPKPKPAGRAEIVSTVEDLLERRPEEDAAINEGMAIKPGEFSARKSQAAPQQQVDLASLSQQEYADYLSKNGLPPGLTAYNELVARPELRGMSGLERNKFIVDNLQKVKDYTNYINSWKLNNIKDIKHVSDDWEHFRINNDKNASGGGRHKSYATFADPFSLTKEDFRGFLEKLRDSGYNGQVKIPSTASRFINSFDNLVMHGATEADAQFARQAALDYFGDKISHTQMGRDSDTTSHTDMLAKQVEQAIKNRKAGTGQTSQTNTQSRGGFDLTPFKDLPLPKTLAGAKPRYKTIQLNFNNDLAKALYIAKDKDASNAYYKWLVRSGVPEEAIPTLGQAVTDHIRGIAEAQTSNDPISVGPEALTAASKKQAARKPKAAPESANAPEAATEETAAPEDGLSEEERAFEEEIAPTKRPRKTAAQEEEGPPDAERLKRSREIVNAFLKAMEARGEAGKTAAQASRRALFDKDVSHAEVHHLFVAHDIASRILGGTGANPTLAHVRKVAYDARRLRAGTKEGGIRGLIEFSLEPGSLPYMRETAYHEAFHVIQDLMQQYDPETAKLVFGAFKNGMTLGDVDGSIKRTLQMFSPEKGGPSYWDTFSQQYTADTKAGAELRKEFGKQREAMAYMFGMLADAKAQGHNISGLKPAFKRFLNFMAQLRQRMGNYLRGQGYRSLQDVLNDYATGKAQQGYGAEVPVSGAPEEAEYAYVGERSKKWSKETQARAEELEAQDVNPIDIYKETGLHRGLRDRKWRAEVPDAFATFKDEGLAELTKKNKKVALKDIYDHSELYESYPWAENVQIVGKPLPEREATYYPRENLIEVSNASINLAIKGFEKGLKRIFVHEIQHVIQDHEKFAPGASVSGIKSQVVDNVRDAVIDLKTDMKQLLVKPMKEITGENLDSDWMDYVDERLAEVANDYNVGIYQNGFFTKPIKNTFLDVSPAINKKISKEGIIVWDKFLNAPAAKSVRDDVIAALMSDQRMARASKVVGVAREFYNELEDKLDKWEKAFKKNKTAAFDLYENEPGERESRDTEDRLNLLSDEDRAVILPWALDNLPPVANEGELGQILNSQKYFREWANKLNKVVEDVVPKAQEYEVLSDYADEFSKRGGAVAPQTAQQAWNEAPIIDPYSLVGEHVVPLIADLAEADGHFTGIDSSQFADKAEGRYGGPGYPFMYNSKQHNLGWAFATQGAANNILNKTYDEIVVDENGNQRVEKRPVKYAVVLAMTPDTHRSNNSFARSLLKNIDAYVRDGRITAAQIEALDLIAKGGAKGKAEDVDLSDFPGFKSGKALSYMENTSFEKRIELAKRMSSKAAAENGVPNVDRIARALIAKDHAGTPYYHGILLIELPTGADRRPIDLAKEGLPIHPSYKFAIKGKVVGKFATTVNNEILWKDWFADKREEAKTKVTPKGQPPNIRRAFELAKPATLITKEIADLIPAKPIDIQSAKAAELAVNIALDKWTSSDDPVKDGGVKPAEFISALMASDAHSSLTDYGWIPAVEEKDGTISAEGFKTDPVKNLTGMVKRGDIKLFKLQGSETYFAIKNEGNGRKSLVSVINNEPGARGVGGPAVVLKAIQEGVTDLDCYAVPSAKYPDGFLNEFYSKFGFEETDSYPFDEKYVKDPSFGGSETKYNDLLHFWRESGWDESMGFPKLSIMEWRGSDAFRENPVRGYLAKSREASRPEGNSADVAGAAGQLEPVSEQIGGEGEAGVGRADTGGLRNGRPARNADTFVRTLVNSLKLTENEARVFGLAPERVAQAKEAVPEVDEFSKRGGDPVFVRTYKDLRESARSRADWRDWYDRHDKLLRDTFGDDAELFQSILSATSQAASVAANVGLALKAYRQLKSNANQFEGFLPAVIKNLERIRADEALRGAKISEYGKASAGDEEGIAVDRHIAMIMFGKKAPNAREIAVAKEWIRDIAKDLGWKPREVQAALWAANQVIQGKDPADVRSYDYFLDKKASQIAALRSAFPDTGGTAASVRESGKAVQSGEERSQRGGVEEGEKAIGRAIQNAGSQAITNFGKVKRFLKSTFDPLAELPEREQYLLLRYRTLGNVSALEREAKGFYDIMKKATDAQKTEIYDYLTTRGAVAPAGLPPELRNVAIQVKNRINQIGADLVSRGIVSPQSVAMYRDKYLPRLYMKYLLEEKGIAGSGIGVGPQQYTKERKSIGAEERVAMGEVTEPSFLSFAALYRPQRDMAILDFLEDVATSSGTDWVLPDQLLDWRGSRVTAFWLSDEAKNIRERMLYEPNAAKKATMERVANQMQALADPHLNGLVPENYKRLPKSNRYGALKGLAVRKEIYDDLIAAGGFDPDPSWVERTFGDRNSSLARATQFWKMTKTILNPPTQVRNFISNAVMLNLSGVPLHKVVPRLLQAIDAMRSNSYAWKIAKEYGIDAGGFGENELRDAKQVLEEYLAQNVTGVMNPKQIGILLGKMTEKMGNAYQWSEMVFKTAKIIDELERKGVAQMPAGAAKTKAEGLAALEGHKWFFDYSLVPRSIKALRTMPFGAPFITYYYKALPLLVEVASNPKTAMRFAFYVGLQAALPMLVASLYDVDDDDVEKLKNSMSEQLREKPGMVMIPYKDQKDRWQFLDAGYFFPWSMFLQTLQSVAKGDISGALGSVGALSSPALSAVTALKTNIDPFSGREIINPIDPPHEKMKALLNYVNSLIAPPILTSYGALGKALEAAQGSGTNRYGEPNMTATQIGLRAMGINIYPLIPELQRDRNIDHLRRELTMLKGRENQAVRDRSIKTDEERIAIRDRYRDERMRLQEKIQQYIKDTELHPNLRTPTNGKAP